MKNRGGHVVKLRAVTHKFVDGLEDAAQQFQRGQFSMASANLLQSLLFELGFVAIARVGQTIGVEQQGVLGFELHG